jgi:transposase
MKNQKIKLSDLQINDLVIFKENKECSATELKRVLAILLVDRESSPNLIKDLTGFNQKYGFELRKKYIDRGIESLKDRRKKKPRALLTTGQRKEIIKTITTLSPRAFGYDEDHWATYILAALIREQYGVQYKSKTSLYIIFREAKFSYHKPDKQYKNRNQKVIDNWLENNRKIIQEILKDDNNVVLVEDEMMLSTQTTTQKIWLPRGEFPKIDVSSKRQNRCIYGFLNIKTGQEFAFKTLRANSEESIKALETIGKLYKNKKIVLIWDNAIWHKSTMVKRFLAQTKYHFHLINFPPYAPELNPQEHVWKKGRSNISHNEFIENIDLATDRFVKYLNETFFDYQFL